MQAQYESDGDSFLILKETLDLVLDYQDIARESNAQIQNCVTKFKVILSLENAQKSELELMKFREEDLNQVFDNVGDEYKDLT